MTDRVSEDSNKRIEFMKTAKVGDRVFLLNPNKKPFQLGMLPKNCVGRLFVGVFDADPVGHVFYLSFALIALTRIKGLYGGLFRKPIMLIIAAFLMQYVADQNFLYQSNNESWVSGQYGDILYLLAYVLMAWGVIQLCSVHVSIKKDGNA
jgi:hypothetical protein